MQLEIEHEGTTNSPYFLLLLACVSFLKPSNNHILDKKNSTVFSFKALKSEIRLHSKARLS